MQLGLASLLPVSDGLQRQTASQTVPLGLLVPLSAPAIKDTASKFSRRHPPFPVAKMAKCKRPTFCLAKVWLLYLRVPLPVHLSFTGENTAFVSLVDLFIHSGKGYRLSHFNSLCLSVHCVLSDSPWHKVNRDETKPCTAELEQKCQWASYNHGMAKGLVLPMSLLSTTPSIPVDSLWLQWHQVLLLSFLRRCMLWVSSSNWPLQNIRICLHKLLCLPTFLHTGLPSLSTQSSVMATLWSMLLAWSLLSEQLPINVPSAYTAAART